jgi:hypothetical protein
MKFIINRPATSNKWYLHKLIGEIYSKLSINIIGKEYIEIVEFLDFLPADILETNVSLSVDPRMILKYDKTIIPLSIGVIHDITTFISTYNVDTIKLLQNVNIYNVRPLLMDNTIKLTICSDGGLNQNIAGFGAVVSINNEIVIKNKMRLPNITNDYTSHRSEAMGMLSSFLLLDALCKYRFNNNLEEQEIESLILCDNEAVVDTVNKFRFQSPCLKDFYKADADALLAIVAVRKSLLRQNVKIVVKHIKGHQDRGNAPL